MRRLVLTLGVLMALAACGGSDDSSTPTNPSSPSPSPSPSTCSTTVAGLPSSVPAQAGKYQFAITAASNCAWTARADVLWADVTPSSGTGSGTPVLQVSEQTLNDSRTLTLTVNGQGYRVTQGPVNCIYTLDRTSVTAAEQGERVQLGLTTPAGCPWSASTTLTWVRVLTPSGSGSDHVDFEVSPNTGALRQGTVLVAGHTVQVTQPRGN